MVLDPARPDRGEGYHERKGEAHAETQALSGAGERTQRAGQRLSPWSRCNHHGRTPPCRQALIDARVSRVVIAVIDPTSREEGGAAALQAAGISVETGVLRDEALIVLGPWLTALEARRPVITWPYLITSGGIEALPEGTAETAFLRRNADAVLLADGTVTEAVPGAHGAGILELADVPSGADALTAARFLYKGGVRRLLLRGGQDAATPFLDAGILDRVLAYTPEGNASRRRRIDCPGPRCRPVSRSPGQRSGWPGADRGAARLFLNPRDRAVERALSQVAYHWWWRPGWHVGRRFYTVHATFADIRAVQDLGGEGQGPARRLAGPRPDPRAVGCTSPLQGISGSLNRGQRRGTLSAIMVAGCASPARRVLSPVTVAIGPRVVAGEGSHLLGLTAEGAGPGAGRRLRARHSLTSGDWRACREANDWSGSCVGVRPYASADGPGEPIGGRTRGPCRCR